MKSSQLRLFPDDSIIYKTIKSPKDCDILQEDLDAAARWESDWLMAFHPDRCSVLTITNKKNPVKHNYLLHNHTLESVSSAKYLGITLQSDLQWTQHAINIVANANKSLGFLKRNLKTMYVTLLVLWYLLQAYLAARRWTISILLQCSAV
jgi:myo-inositol-hexaphosphate 3-phosphohydrolase